MRVTHLGRVLIVQALLGVAAIMLLLARNDLWEAVRSLPHLHLDWAVSALALFAVSRVLQGARWKFLLRHRPGLPFRWLLGLFIFANFVNAVVPLRVGDVLRIELLNRRFGLPRAEVASNVVVVESLFDGMSYVLLLLGSVLLVDIPAALRPALLGGAVVIVALFALAAAAIRRGWRWDPDRTRLFARLPRPARLRMAQRIGDLTAGMATLRSTRDLLIGLALSLVGWLLEVTVYWMLARAFAVQLSFAQTLIVTVAANLATAVPLTPWNVGPYELAVTELLVLLGADRGAVAPYAVGAHVLLVGWITVTGIVAMFAIGLGVNDLRRRVHELPRAIEADRRSGSD